MAKLDLIWKKCQNEGDNVAHGCNLVKLDKKI